MKADPRPDVVIVLADDMGFSDIGCYGGEIETPNLDRLAAAGVRMSQFYNTARCSPSRASLLTGLHPHQTGIGILTEDQRPIGYAGSLSEDCVTIAEVLGEQGYGTYMSGKWHLSHDMENPNSSWPSHRGFDGFYGTITGAADYYHPATLTRGDAPEPASPGFYYTDAISSEAASFVFSHQERTPDTPLFLYVAYTAPHWPLHALEEDIAVHRGRYDGGWDVLRQERLRRLVESGLIDGSTRLGHDPAVPEWDTIDDREWEARRMEVYAAQVHAMDRGVGTVLDALETAGRLDNTIFLFLSDNGGCAENVPNGWVDEVPSVGGWSPTHSWSGQRILSGNRAKLPPGGEESFQSYGRAWAQLSNTPFREYKHWVHEGGIATPFIVHWPDGLRQSSGGVVHEPHQLPDVMATVLEASGVAYPASRLGHTVVPLEGHSMITGWLGEAVDDGHLLYWEHEGNASVRGGRWKLVRKYPQDWELYDLSADRSETIDLRLDNPAVAERLAAAYDEWARRCGVVPRELLLEHSAEEGDSSWVE